MTSLIGGQRVPKCDDRVEAYGTVDELSAFLAVLHDSLPASDVHGTRAFLMEVQGHLLSIEAVLACPEEGRIPHLDASAVEAVEERVPHLDVSALTAVENRIHSLEQALPPLRSFILPGGNLTASYCHVCRTVCRRAERKVVKLGYQGVELRYLNRLSDYFFLLARFLGEG